MTILVNISLAEVPLDEALARVEAQLYKHAMEVAKFNQSKAARLLKVSRGTLRVKLKEHHPGVYID